MEEMPNATNTSANEDYVIVDLSLGTAATGCFGDWATWSAGTWSDWGEYTEGELYPTH